MKPEEITIESLEEASGIPVDKWHGKCALLAHCAAELLHEECHELYGHYKGEIDETGYWTNRIITRHGWVLLEDGRVLDPTRWSFENVEPYIYLEYNDEDYDEGGDKLREDLEKPCPPPDGKLANMKECLASAPLFERLTKTQFDKLTVNQVGWVANLSYHSLDFAVGHIYKTLIENNFGAIIPLDNKQRAIREGRLKLGKEAR
jgi:hypothetical protein